MATLTLEGSADQTVDGDSLKEVGDREHFESGHMHHGVQQRTIAQCCRQCAAIVQVYSKHRYERDSIIIVM